MTTTRIASDGKPIEVTDTPAGLSESAGIKNSIVPVSYTHLTLPTSDLV